MPQTILSGVWTTRARFLDGSVPQLQIMSRVTRQPTERTLRALAIPRNLDTNEEQTNHVSIFKEEDFSRPSFSSVVVCARQGTAYCNVLLDTGAGPSIYSSITSVGPVYDASGTRINLIGSLTLPVVIGPVLCTAHQTQVVNTSNWNLILGRDFPLSQFDSTTFHWIRNEVATNGRIIKSVSR